MKASFWIVFPALVFLVGWVLFYVSGQISNLNFMWTDPEYCVKNVCTYLLPRTLILVPMIVDTVLIVLVWGVRINWLQKGRTAITISVFPIMLTGWGLIGFRLF